MKFITRLGPSPTSNFCHVGNIRTLLYNYFLAKKTGGKFFIRLEDTDRDRYSPQFLDYFKETLDWLGIVPDASYWNPDPTIGSFIQSERDYSQKIQYLLDNGFAYYAFDTKDELQKRVSEDSNFKYDFNTRLTLNNSLALNEKEVNNLLDNRVPYVIRFKVPNDTLVHFDDQILGKISINTNQIDDKVLLKSNGVGSYHLCNVCDDHDMGITHVLRGQEWVSSTPFHILLYKAFGWNPPIFAHLPLILNPDGKGKLSKRTAAKYGIPIAPIGYTDEFGNFQPGWRELGYEPSAFINTLSLIGWNSGTDQEIFTNEELIESFSLDKINRSSGRFDMKKATWINSQWVRTKLTDEELTENIDLSNIREDVKSLLISEAKIRSDFRHQLQNFILPLTTKQKTDISTDHTELINSIIKEFQNIHHWTPDNISKSISEIAIQHNIKQGKILELLRKIVIYNNKGIDVKTSLFIIGKTESILRISEVNDLKLETIS